TQNINLDYQHEEDQLKNKNENLSAFLYNRLAFGPAIINFGARVDSNKYYNEHVTYKIALMHFFSRFTLKMSYSTGFRAPSLNQLFDPTYGNKNLKPEESQTAEAGFDVPVGDKLKYIGTFFYTDLKNRLSYDPNTFVNQNRGRAKIVGWENNFHTDISEEFKNHTTLTWMSARDTTARTKLPRRPNLNIKSSIEYAKNNHSAEISGDFTGKRADVDNLGNATLMPSYFILNLSYSYRVTENFSTYAKLHNLLDKDYEEVFGYGTGGRAGTLGLKYDF
ncbi:MAG: TonB-dependent receptor, partial [Bdellovibrionales bacterium]|nr:TonB-dependent receptor [Bdellovibrionales bacterium]